MQLKRIKKFHKISKVFFGAIAQNNIVFACGLALPFCIVVSTSLKNAVALSIAMFFSTVPAAVISSLFAGKLPSWLRPVLYVVTSGVFVTLSSFIVRTISPYIFDSLGVYFSMIVVNSIMFTTAEKHEATGKPLRAVLDAVVCSMGFALAIIILSFLRELFGRGTLWGIPMSFGFELSAVPMAFFGFILVGLFAALVKFVRRCIMALIYRKDNKTPLAADDSQQEGV